MNDQSRAERPESAGLTKPTRRGRAAALLILVAGAVLSMFACWDFRKFQQTDLVSDFRRLSEERISAVHRTIQDSLNGLESLHAFWIASEHVTRSEFASFTKLQMTLMAGTLAMEWIPRVPLAQRADFERQAMADGLNPFAITELNDDGDLVPAGRRDEYFPVRYVEPVKRNEAAIGFDLSSDPVRREALLRAWSMGQAIATAPVNRIKDDNQHPGTLVFLPIFTREDPISPLPPHRQNLEGFVLGVFRVGDLIEEGLRGLAPGGIHLRIDDVSEGDPVLLYHHRSRFESGERRLEDLVINKASPLDLTRKFEVAGRRWAVSCAPASDLIMKHVTASPWLILAGGITFTALLSLYVFSLATQRMRAEQLVHQRTAELRAREEKLRESEERYRLLLQNANDAVFVHHLSHEGPGNFIEVNEQACRMLGYTREELLGMSIPQIDVPKQHERVPLIIQALFTTGRALFETEHRAKDGKRILVEVSARLFTLHGKDTVLAAVRDVSERKLAEAERLRLITAMEQAGEAFLITDPEGTIEYVNPAFEGITGFSRKEAVGRKTILLKSDAQDRQFFDHLWATIKGGKTWSGRMVNRRKDGTLFTADCTVSPVFEKDGEIRNFVSVLRDVSDEIRMAQQLQQAQKMESVGRIAAGLAHDFNNMLSPILGYAEMLLMDLHPADERHGQVTEIKKAAERSRDLVQQLLAFSRKQMLNLRVVDLREVVDGMRKLLGRTLREDIHLKVVVAPSACHVKADVGQVEQILMNLAVNAQDAMPKGGHLTIEVGETDLDDAFCADHHGASPGRHGALIVSDTGLGMDEETKRQIFEPFFSTKGELGTGLGLATVYGIVKQHGGSIWAYSEPGKGTTFKVYLPAASSDTAVTPIETPEPRARVAGTETILVVEDNDMVRDLARSILQRIGYTVLDAGSGREALRILEVYTSPLHLLLTDVVMPDMNGKELLAKIHEKHPGLKALFMSGYTGEVIARHGVLEAGVHFIQKPFSVQGLAAKVREVLDSK